MAFGADRLACQQHFTVGTAVSLFAFLSVWMSLFVFVLVCITVLACVCVSMSLCPFFKYVVVIYRYWIWLALTLTLTEPITHSIRQRLNMSVLLCLPICMYK